MKKDNLMMSIIIINFIISALVLIYYFYILKYINKLKDNEICDKLNYPYLNIFYGIIIIIIVFLVISFVIKFPFVQRLFGINSISLLNLIIKYGILIIIISLCFNTFIVKLLYDIGNQPKCKDIYPNFRIFIYIIASIDVILNLMNLYSALVLKPLSNKELKTIKKYLKKSKKKS
jgi:hypothetical protein|tara:strand:+ start:191 stop:715 length:525 start_codon:yes stop_codon:yes gene_type:complete